MELDEQSLKNNLQNVQAKIKAACTKVHRDSQEVKLLPVSKLKPVADMKVLMAAGQHAFGENYVQEIRSKYEELGDSVEWHMIGHLQRNKVKYIIDKVAMIHSVDSLRLAKQIEKEAEKAKRDMDILLEVNIANEESKWGFKEDEVLDAVKEISQFSHVHLRGLMTSAPYTTDPESNRPYFKGMRLLLEKVNQAHIGNVVMDTLSMGMTADYEVAVEEGATIVRVGTAIFGARDYNK
jgi:pyridoxal phosphate enzyme (YggS family)